MTEPVAHRFKWEEKMSWQYGDGYDATGAPNDPDYFAYEPLYTHPMRELTEDTECQYCKQGCFRCDSRKALTDEEISQVYKEVSEPFGEKRLYEIHDFARAILKKAIEK